MVRKKDAKVKVSDLKKKQEKSESTRKDTAAERKVGKQERRQKQTWMGGTDSAPEKKPGCNTPTGCLLGEGIPAGARKPPPGAVCVRCSNESCPAVPWLHEECYDKWEKFLIKVMMSTHGRARNLNERESRKLMWSSRFYEIIQNECRCTACTGKIRREMAEEKLATAQAHPKPKAAASGVEKHQSEKKAQTAPASGTTKAKELPKLSKPGDYGYFQTSSGASASQATRGYVSQREKGTLQRTSFSHTASGEERTRVMSESRTLPPYGFSRCSFRDDDLSSETGSVSSGRSLNFSGRETHNPTSTYCALVEDAGAWPSLPGGERSSACLDMESEGCESSASGNPQVGDGGVPRILDDAAGVSKDRFLKDLESLVRIYGGKLMESHRVVQDELEKCGVSLMSEMCDLGGFAQWLSLNSEKMCVVQGEILLKAQNGVTQRNGIGSVLEGLKHEDGSRRQFGVVIQDETDDVILFDWTTRFSDGHSHFLKGDKVSFLATEKRTSPVSSHWFIVEMMMIETASGVQRPSPDSHKSEVNEPAFSTGQAWLPPPSWKDQPFQASHGDQTSILAKHASYGYDSIIPQGIMPPRPEYSSLLNELYHPPPKQCPSASNLFQSKPTPPPSMHFGGVGGEPLRAKVPAKADPSDWVGPDVTRTSTRMRLESLLPPASSGLAEKLVGFAADKLTACSLEDRRRPGEDESDAAMNCSSEELPSMLELLGPIRRNVPMDMPVTEVARSSSQFSDKSTSSYHTAPDDVGLESGGGNAPRAADSGISPFPSSQPEHKNVVAQKSVPPIAVVSPEMHRTPHGTDALAHSGEKGENREESTTNTHYAKLLEEHLGTAPEMDGTSSQSEDLDEWEKAYEALMK